MTDVLQTVICSNSCSGLSFNPETGPSRSQVAMLMAIRGECQDGAGCPAECEIGLLLDEIATRTQTDAA